MDQIGKENLVFTGTRFFSINKQLGRDVDTDFVFPDSFMINSTFIWNIYKFYQKHSKDKKSNLF